MKKEKKLRLEKGLKEYVNDEIPLKDCASNNQLNSHELSQYIKSKGFVVKNKKSNKDKYYIAQKEYIEKNITIQKLSKKYHIHPYSFSNFMKENGIKISNRKYFYDESFFESIDTEEKAYWLGFILADGNVSRKTLKILLSKKDTKHLEKFSKIFDIPIKFRTYHDNRTNKKYSSCFCSLHSKKICSDLEKFRIVPNKTLVDNDTILEMIDDSLKNHFIRGYFDGDGHVGFILKSNVKEFRVDFCGSKGFLESIKNYLVEKLELNPVKIRKEGSIYHLTWGGNRQIEKIKNVLYDKSLIYMERKRNIFNQLETSPPSSKFRGVSWNKKLKKWRTFLCHNKKIDFLGSFNSEIEAALKYNEVAEKVGKTLNKIPLDISNE